MSINLQALAAAIRSVGVATVYIGDPFTASGLTALGVTEGDITVDVPITENALKATEYTGDVPHAINVMAGDVTGVIPLIMGDAAIWPKIMPTGTLGVGWSNQQPVVTTSMAIIPNAEITAAGMSYNGTVWAPAAPVNAFWFWKVALYPGSMNYHFGDGGKVIMPVRYHAMFDAARPEGHKVLTIGNPVSAGITTLRI